MPDYAACANRDCLSKSTCCRYLMNTATSIRQSTMYIEGDGTDCDYYWDTSDGAPFEILSLEEKEKFVNLNIN